MDLQFKKPTSNDEWDKYVLQLENYSFVISGAKYTYIEESPKESFRYLVFDNDEFVGIVGGIIDRVKIFGKYLECKHNPMLKEGLSDERKEDILRGIFKKLQAIALEHKCFFVRVSPLIIYDEIYNKVYTQFGAVESPVQPQDALISQYFDTTKELEELHREMNKSSRSNVNKLKKDDNVKVEVVRDDSVFDIFKDFYKQTKEYKGYRGKSAENLLREFEIYMDRDMLYFLIAYTKGEPVSVWQMVRFGKYMHHYQAGSDLKFKEKNVRLLFWRALELCKDIGVEVLDLFGGMLPEGEDDEKNPWKGINDFKMSLGGKKVTYMHPRDIPLRHSYSIFQPYARLRIGRKGHTVDW